MKKCNYQCCVVAQWCWDLTSSCKGFLKLRLVCKSVMPALTWRGMAAQMRLKVNLCHVWAPRSVSGVHAWSKKIPDHINPWPVTLTVLEWIEWLRDPTLLILNTLMNRSRNDSHLGPLLPAGTWAQVIGIQFGISRESSLGFPGPKYVKANENCTILMNVIGELVWTWSKTPIRDHEFEEKWWNDEKHMETWCTSQPTIQD